MDSLIDKSDPEVTGRVSQMPPVAPGDSVQLRPAYEERCRDPRKRGRVDISEWGGEKYAGERKVPGRGNNNLEVDNCQRLTIVFKCLRLP